MNLKHFGYFSFFLFCTWTSVFAETMDASSRIVDAVVFPDRALVTRRASVDLVSGSHEIKLGPVPAGIETGSLTVKGKGEAKVTLFGARLETRQLSEPQSERVKDIQLQIERKEDERRALEDRKQVWAEKQKFLQSIQAATGEQIGKELVTRQPSAADTADMVKFLDQQFILGYEDVRKADLALKEVAKEIDRLNREMGELYGQQSRSDAFIIVDLLSEDAGKFTLDVSYRIYGASWEPIYEVRAVSDSKDISFALSGLVRQSTGEDWNEVTLHLSTARPALSGRLPEIEPWYLRPVSSAPRERADTFGMAMLSKQNVDSKEGYERKKDAPASLALEEMAAAPAEAQVNSQGPAVFYTLSRPETAASNGQPKKVSIASYTLPAKFAFEAAPRLSPYAYLRAQVTNQSQSLFLPGQIQIFLNGNYIGQSYLKTTGPEETFDVYLGTDERIRVEQKQIKAKEDLSVLPGIRGRVRTIDYEYLTTLENFQSKAVELILADQIPVSQHDDIKVEQVTMTPAAPEADKEKPGVYRWKLMLEPKAKQIVKLVYRVKYPESFSVEGI